MITTKEEIEAFYKKLFPITRSLTGNGNLETIRILNEIINLNVSKVPTGEKVFDWTIPNEWNIKEAWIKNTKGEKIIDIANSNIHIMSYSESIHTKLKLKELAAHLFYLLEQPNAIPYKTSYYHRNWGFCLTYNDYKNNFNDEEEYEVFIDSELKEGHLSYADYLIEGKSQSEYLISTYFCHPSMVNDNLSGVLLTAFLAKEFSKLSLNYSYRFVFIPETIGAITYCWKNEEKMKNLLGGFVVSCVAGPGKFGYKKTYLENSLLDRIVNYTLFENGIDFIKYPFEPQGSDERQYSSPGFRIPVGLITKDKFHEYEYYHTSLDDLNFAKPEYLIDSLKIYLEVIKNLDANQKFISLNPNCEPQLGRRGLYPTIGRRTIKSNTESYNELDVILWLLFYGDGSLTLFEIHEKTGIAFADLVNAAEILKEKNLMNLMPVGKE